MKGGTLSLDAVELAIGGRAVVRDVSLEVAPGEVVGLLGRNGVGKTTLVRIASGAAVPDRGEVRLAGTALAQLSRREIARRLAVVAQDTHVPFPFRVSELVLMGRAPHQRLFGFESARDIERATDSMQRMGIEPLADRSILELSGGERQLVMIARALTQEPEFLLLDEPTAFLDLSHRIEVMQVVRELAAEGRGALVVSHDLTLAARGCDRVVLLAEGVVAAAGPPNEVLTRDTIYEVFGIDAEVMPGTDRRPVIVPHLSPVP